MNKTIAIIPARGGSKRLPGKNIKLLAGIPLIAHSIKYAKANKCIDQVYVSTDDNEIKQVAIQFGALVVDRPENISGDFEPTVSALKHVLENISDKIENVVLLQATNPLRPNNLLKDAISFFNANNCDSLFTVSRDFHKLGKIEGSNFIPYNYKVGQRSQDLEPLYFENGLLYITKKKNILNNEIITNTAYPYQVNHVFANVDIDELTDFEYAEYILNRKNDEL